MILKCFRRSSIRHAVMLVRIDGRPVRLGVLGEWAETLDHVTLVDLGFQSGEAAWGCSSTVC